MPASFRPTPSIPNLPPDTPKELRPLLRALRDATMVRFGQSRNRLDRSVTVRELTELGLLDGDGNNVSIGTRLAQTLGVNPNGDSGGDTITPSTPDINGVDFTVTTSGVIINWTVFTGLQADAISYTEIWRVGPFTPLNDDSYPAMVIGTDANGDVLVNWVDPVNALDDEGAPLPTPTVALTGTAVGSIYSEYIESSKSYVYFLRFIGTDGAPTAWHSLSGSRVDGLVDYQALLDILAGQVSEAQLNSTLNNRIDQIELIDLELNQLTTNTNAANLNLSNALSAEILDRQTAISGEAAERRARWADMIDYMKVVDSAWDVKQEGRKLITDATIQTLQTTMNEGDSALAAQIQAIVAASGSWYVQANEPDIDPTWDGTYHWVDTDNQNRHFVSTDVSRADAEDLWAFASADAQWTDNGDGSYTGDGSAAAYEINGVSQLVMGETYVVGCYVTGATQGSFNIILGAGVSPLWEAGTDAEGLYIATVTSSAASSILLRAVSFDGTISNLFCRPLALDVWPASPTLSASWVDEGNGVYLHDETISADGLITGGTIIPAEGEYRISFNCSLPTQGTIALYVAGVVRGAKKTTGGFHSITFSAFAGNNVALRAEGGFNGVVSDIVVRRTSGWQGWIDVSDTRIAANLAAILNEQVTRIDSDESLASSIANIFSQIDDPTSGLSALAQGQEGILTYVNDQGANGLLASSSKFTNLTTRVTNAETAIDSNTTAISGLSTYIDDNGPNGFIQSALFGTELGTNLADAINGAYATTEALNGLETYVNNQGPDGLLASSSKFTSLETDVTNLETSVAGVATAIDDLSTYVNDEGVDGFLSSATRFTNLETAVADAQDDLSGLASAFDSLDTLVRDDTETGYLATSTRFTGLVSRLDSAEDEISGNATALQELSTYLADTTDQGYIQQTLFNTTLGTDLADAINELYATNAALSGLQTYVNNQGPDGLLAMSSNFTDLQTAVTNNTTNIASASKAVSDLTTYVDDQSEDGFLAQATLFQALQTQVDNIDSLVGGNADAISSLSTYINDQGADGFLAQAQNFIDLSTSYTALSDDVTNLDTAVGSIQDALTNDIEPALTANADATSALETYINDQGVDGFLANASKFTTLETAFNDFEDAIDGRAGALETWQATLEDQTETGWLASSTYLAQQYATIADNTAAIEHADTIVASEADARATAVSTLQANIDAANVSIGSVASAVADVEGNVYATYSNKIQLDYDSTTKEHRITGFEFFDSNGSDGSTSSFIIQADLFMIRSASDPNNIPLSMNGDTLSLNLAAVEINGLIGDANLGEISVGKITGNTADFVEANIGDGVITSAKIAQEIRSTNYESGKSGWAINKNGTAQFYNVTARGNIEAASIRATAANIVDTLQVKGEAITVNRGANGYVGGAIGSSWTPVRAVSVAWPSTASYRPSAVIVMGVCNFLAQKTGSDRRTVRVRLRTSQGTVLAEAAITTDQAASTSLSTVGKFGKPTAANMTYYIDAKVDSGSGYFKSGQTGLVVMGGKR